jgi:hypothetical protein
MDCWLSSAENFNSSSGLTRSSQYTLLYQGGILLGRIIIYGDYYGLRGCCRTCLRENAEQALFEQVPEEFNAKVAQKPEEIKQLLEVGFEYVCEKDGLTFFRKRK